MSVMSVLPANLAEHAEQAERAGDRAYKIIRPACSHISNAESYLENAQKKKWHNAQRETSILAKMASTYKREDILDALHVYKQPNNEHGHTALHWIQLQTVMFDDMWFLLSYLLLNGYCDTEQKRQEIMSYIFEYDAVACLACVRWLGFVPEGFDFYEELNTSVTRLCENNISLPHRCIAYALDQRLPFSKRVAELYADNDDLFWSINSEDMATELFNNANMARATLRNKE